MTDPDALVAELRHKLAGLDPNPPPRTFSPHLWRQFIADSAGFFDGDDQWGLLAISLGWDPLQLLGCDSTAPHARIDHQGLLWLVHGALIVEIDERGCTIQHFDGNRLTYRRHPMPPNETVLPWELGE